MGKAIVSGEDFPLNQSIDIYIYKCIDQSLHSILIMDIYLFF